MTPSALIQGPTSASSHSLPRHGTPPLSRNSSSGSYSKRSSVVPFTRPGRPSDDGTEAGTPSQSGTPVGYRPRRTSSSQGLHHSLEDCSFSQSPAQGRRAGEDRGPSGNHPAARAEGFKVVPDTACRRTSESSASPAGEESPKGAGLLSRHFSGNIITGSPPPSGEVLKERLQKCLDKPASGLHHQSKLQPESAASRLLRQLQGQFEVFSLPSVVHAFAVASSVLRDNHHIGRGQPPMVRNLETAAILAELGASTACISAALFHGALEVQAMSESRLRETLQHDVASLAMSSARLADLCKVRRQAAIGMDPDTLRKFSHMLLAMADVQAVILVLADRLQMLRAQDSTSVAARDVLEVFAPLADQLGVWSLKAELEDLAFQALHPREYAELRTQFQANLQLRTIEHSLETLKEAVGHRGISNVDLVGRPKNLYSVWKKMRGKGYNLQQLYDLRALRIVVRSKADCYWALREVEQLWQVVPGRDKDYIRQPKANGYQSLHTVVIADDGIPMEVQIRTDKMHFIAEYGVAAHWRYKEDADVRDVAREQQVAWARMLISWQLELADKKLRPAGSPAHDTTLSHICPFPSHDSTCPAADTNGFLARHAPRAGGGEQAPVYVIVQDHASQGGRQGMAIKELPANSTASQLHELLQLQRAALQTKGPATYLMVNGRRAVDDQPLFHGDKVEVLSQQDSMGPHHLPGQLHAVTHVLPPQVAADMGSPAVGPVTPNNMYSPRRLATQTSALRN